MAKRMVELKETTTSTKDDEWTDKVAVCRTSKRSMLLKGLKGGWSLD